MSHPEMYKRKEQRLTDRTGSRGLIQIPQHGHEGRDFQSMWITTSIIPQCQLTLNEKELPQSIISQRENFQKFYREAHCLALTGTLKLCSV